MKIEEGMKVKDTYRKFTGTVLKEDFGGYWMITPGKPELKELYPFGIRSHESDLYTNDKEE